MGVELKYHGELTKTDPSNHPVIIIGQIKYLNQLKYSQISCKIAPKVSEEVYNAAIGGLQPSADPFPLYLNSLAVGVLPLKCSRHNTPSRAHSLVKLVEKGPVKTEGSIVIVCERREVYASACAAARAFPNYSRKTSGVPGLSLPKPEAKSKKSTTVNIEFIILKAIGEGYKLSSEKLSPSDLELFQNSAFGIRLSQEIIDKPCNEMNVDGFLKEITKVGQLLNIQPVIIRGEELREKGFGGIYGVGKAANCPPALAVLSHTLPGARNTIAWVGKGIVYDTGGLSIKSAAGMVSMKGDCGGAAGILGAFYLAVKSNFNQNLHAVFCLAENSVGPDSTRPDDIHTLYSGRTVEINNPDAEGRLVMADGVVYAQKDLKANIILDMATLTGAQGIATGKYHGALMSNSEEWERYSLEAGIYSGDLLFEVPYTPELHFSEYASVVADMKNSVADRKNAQVSCAGLFMMAHLGFDYPGSWIHIDMASPGFSSNKNGQRSLGYGVALLNSLFGKYTNQPLLANAVQQFSETTGENPAKKQRLE